VVEGLFSTCRALLKSYANNINYHRKNHNVETYRIKRKENHVPIVSEVAIQHIKIQRLVRYSYHICGDIRHQIIDYFKYSDMQNMFINKIVKLIDKQAMVKPKVSNPLIHMVDVNMAITKSKVIEK
jgi:hypothetical protein